MSVTSIHHYYTWEPDKPILFLTAHYLADPGHGGVSYRNDAPYYHVTIGDSNFTFTPKQFKLFKQSLLPKNISTFPEEDTNAKL